MSTFVWTIAVLGAWELCGAMFYFAKDVVPERTRFSMAWNAASWAAFLGWAIYLIGAGS